MATTTVYPNMTCVTTPDKKVTNELPAQKDAKMVKKKKKKPESRPDRPTAQKVVAAKVRERNTREGMDMREWART